MEGAGYYGASSIKFSDAPKDPQFSFYKTHAQVVTGPLVKGSPDDDALVEGETLKCSHLIETKLLRLRADHDRRFYPGWERRIEPFKRLALLDHFNIARMWAHERKQSIRGHACGK